MRYPLLSLVLASLLSACGPSPEPMSAPKSLSEALPPAPIAVRFASYNTSLYDDQAGGLIARLEVGDKQAQKIAAVLQHMRPDVVLLNEFDYDANQRAIDLFEKRYLAVPQFGLTPIKYDYRYTGPVNTGVPSGLDLDNDGKTDGPADAWGFGRHPGQYGMVVLSRYPIDASKVRSFQHLLWARLPQARRPMNPDGSHFYSDEVWSKLRLSSKSHWDVPIDTALGRVHLLASHPTPPVFDGPENRNGARNADEITFWRHYLASESAEWLCDDAGRCGGLASEARFVIAGDLNADPFDGDGDHQAIAALLADPRVYAKQAPLSEGAAVLAAEYGLPRRGDVAAHTGDFGPRTGTMRLDYVLPSIGFHVKDMGVFWPKIDAPGETWTRATDHRLVWVDLMD